LNTLAEQLNTMTLDKSYSSAGLRHLAALAGLKALQYAKKQAIIDGLLRYYRDPDTFAALWNRLSQGEREMLSLQIWTHGAADYSDYKEIAAKHKMTAAKRSSFYYSGRGVQGYAGEKSAFWLLCPGGDIADEARAEIIKIIGDKMPACYETYQPKADEIIIEREARVDDFADLVRLCNTTKMKVTKTGLLAKAAAISFRKHAAYAEVAADFTENPEDVRTIAELRVSLPLNILAVTSGMMITDNGSARPGSKAPELLNLPPEEFIMSLYSAYLGDKTFSEIDVIKGIKTAKRGLKLFESRKTIAEELKRCPVGEFVSAKDFERYLQLTNRNFARKSESYVFMTQGGYYAEWDDYETPFLRLVLSAFGALGMLDLVWGKSGDRGYETDDVSAIKGFKITELGAFIWDLASSYTPPQRAAAKPGGGFVVQPDYTVMIPDSADRLRHELFFARYLTTVSADAHMAIYKLDFACLARALDLGTSIADVRAYLVGNSDKPVPDNVLRALDDWEKQSGRIKLRQVTILECDEPFLLEEIIRYKGMGEFAQDKIAAAVVIDRKATKQVKKLIEKNKRFCRDII
jgi:hypothetical protein